MSRSTPRTAVKQELLDELDKVPEDALAQILAYVRSQFVATAPGAELDSSFASSDEVLRAYMASEQENEEVYRRLADS